jgi:hypothetical protein
MYQQLAQVIGQLSSPGEMFEIREIEIAGRILKTGALSAAEVREICADKLAALRIQRCIWILDAPLPRSASDRFVKREFELQYVLDIAESS